MRKSRLYITSADQVITCEYCGNTVPASQAYSFISCVAMPGHAQGQSVNQQYEPFQCTAEQHFADTWEHALLLDIVCKFHQENLHPNKGQLKKAVRDNPELAQIESLLRGKIKNGDFDLNP